MNKPIRVLQLLDHSAPLHSGYTFRSLAILRSLKALGVTIVPLTSVRQETKVGDPLEETAEGVHFYRTAADQSKWWMRLPFLGEILLTAQRAEQIARQHSVDIIHAHSPALHGVSAWLAARKLNIPFVYEIRSFWEDAAVEVGKTKRNSLRYRLTRAMETFVCKRANHVFPICEGLKGDLAKRDIPSDKLTTVGNAVEAERFTPIPKDPYLRNELGIAEDTFLFGFFGSLYFYEGLQVACEAAKLLAKENPNFKILILGSGEAESYLQQLCEDPSIGSHVLLKGKVPNSQIQRYYSIVDAMLFPRLGSRLTELTTPLKPLESMAMNKLVLASDIGGHRELIRNGQTGILFPAGSAQACANAMRGAMLMDLEQRRDMLTRADRYVRVERTWLGNASLYLPVYERILST